MVQILIAPNAFKGQLKADQAAKIIQEGLQESPLRCRTELFPVGDGGDGTAELLTLHFKGRWEAVRVEDPLGRPITARFGIIQEDTALIDMASASGIGLLAKDELAPLKSSSIGTGQLILAALKMGIRKFIIGLGGSATVDGGAGILWALGARFLDKQGRTLPPTPENLINLHRVDFSKMHEKAKGVEFIVLCDVNNPLLGPNGAAAIFGPQKGVRPPQIPFFNEVLSKLESSYAQASGYRTANVPRTGTAGGAAAGLWAGLHASLVNGIDFFLEYCGFSEALKKADLVITAEGSLDEQTLEGKAPYGVAREAKKKRIPVIGMAGKIPLAPGEDFLRYFDVLLAINHRDLTLERALQLTPENLKRSATNLGAALAIGKSIGNKD